MELELEPIPSVTDIPTGIAVHGTNRKAWDIIRESHLHSLRACNSHGTGVDGIHRMTRNHIHLAQGVAGSGVISGESLVHESRPNVPLTFMI